MSPIGPMRVGYRKCFICKKWFKHRIKYDVLIKYYPHWRSICSDECLTKARELGNNIQIVKENASLPSVQQGKVSQGNH